MSVLRNVRRRRPLGPATIIPSVAAMVPASVKSKGTYTVAADASYPPDEFRASDGHTVEGGGRSVDLI